MNSYHNNDVDTVVSNKLTLQIPPSGAPEAVEAVDNAPAEAVGNRAEDRLQAEVVAAVQQDIGQTDSELAMPVPIRSVHVDIAPAAADGSARAKGAIERLKVRDLDNCFQCRRLEASVVADYLELLKLGKAFPPVLVVRHDRGNGDVVYYLADGAHRLAARTANGEREIECVVLEGDEQTVKWEVARSNTTHGLPRTGLDKSRQVQMMLDEDDWRDLSDRSIAEHVHVSPTTVGKERAKYNKARGIAPGEAGPRTARDGRKYSDKVPRSVIPRVADEDVSSSAAGSAPDLAPEPQRAQATGLPMTDEDGARTNANDHEVGDLDNATDSGKRNLAQGNADIHRAKALALPVRDSGVMPNYSDQLELPAKPPARSRFRVTYINRSGDAMEAEYDFDHPEIGLAAEIICLSSFISNIKKLRSMKVPRDTLDDLFCRAMTA